jgi:hypothetical protein
MVGAVEISTETSRVGETWVSLGPEKEGFLRMPGSKSAFLFGWWTAALDQLRRLRQVYFHCKKEVPFGRLFRLPGWCKIDGGSSEMAGILQESSLDGANG